VDGYSQRLDERSETCDVNGATKLQVRQGIELTFDLSALGCRPLRSSRGLPDPLGVRRRRVNGAEQLRVVGAVRLDGRS